MTPPLWNGFRYRWRRTSHRLSYLGSRFVDGGHHLTLKIGTFPRDVADYRVWATSLSGAGAPVLGAGAENLRLVSRIGGDASGSVRVVVPSDLVAEAASGAPLTSVVGAALIGGFQIQSVGNTSGWHFGRLAIDMSELQRTEGGFEFDLRVALRPSESPELIHLGNKGWTYDQNCVYDVTVDWVVVLGAPAKLQVTRVDWGTQIPKGIDEVRKGHLSVAGPAGDGDCACAVGLSEIDVTVGSTGGQRRRTCVLRYMEGRNIREVGLWVELEGRDPDSGVTRLAPAVAFSNEPRGSWLLRIGVLAVILTLAILAALAGPNVVGAAVASMALTIALIALRWPGGPLVFPAVPWRLDAKLGCVALHMRGEVRVDARVLEDLHDVPVSPHLSRLETGVA